MNMKGAELEAYNRIKATLALDLMAIDEGLIQSPMILQEVGEWTAKAVFRRDGAKNEIPITEAQEARKIKAEAEKAEEKPPSEAAIKSTLPGRVAVQNALTYAEDTKLLADLWFALTAAVKARNDALEYICKMQIAGYLTPSFIRDDRRKEMHEARTKIHPRPTTRKE